MRHRRPLEVEVLPARPVFFSPPMVKAILEGKKTQTRRVIDVPHRIVRIGTAENWDEGRAHPKMRSFNDWGPKEHFFVFVGENTCFAMQCPYGSPGELLWVRERMRVIDTLDHGSKTVAVAVRYECDGTESGWIDYPDRLKGEPWIGRCLAYAGYREAARLLLRIKSVRVERIRDISKSDAVAEGLQKRKDGEWVAPDNLLHYAKDPRIAFSFLWDSINKKRGYGWDAYPCPWVWVIEFEEYWRRAPYKAHKLISTKDLHHGLCRR